MACVYGAGQNCDECGMCAEKKEREKVKVAKAEIFENKKTNADWIRNMSNEEFAKFLLNLNNLNPQTHCLVADNNCNYLNSDKSCKTCIEEWLESERD